MLNVPIRLMLMTLVNFSSECGPSLPTVFSPIAMPAQLTSAVQSAELLERRVHRGLAMVLAGDVALDINARLLAELAGQCLALRLVDVGDDGVAAGGDDHFDGAPRRGPTLPPVTMNVLFLISMFVYSFDWKT